MAIGLNAAKPTEVNYIRVVAKIPAGFENGRTLQLAPGLVTFASTTGQRVTAPVRQ